MISQPINHSTMKKYLFILLAAIAFVACSDEEETNIIRPVNAPADVKAFFQSEIGKEFGESNTILSDTRIVHSPVGGDVRMPSPDTCCVINSRAELAAIYAGEKQLPDIDFTKYTLVVGKEEMPQSPFILEGMSLTEEENLLVLTLKVKSTENCLMIDYQMRYWALYPKLPGKPIMVKVVGRP